MRGTVRGVLGALIAAVMLLAAACQQAPSDVGPSSAAFSQDGSPLGDELGQALVSVTDAGQTLDVRVSTLRPNPAGSPLSCDHNAVPDGARLVPVYVNVTPHDPKHGAKDTSLTIAIRSDGAVRPLLLVTRYDAYQPVCQARPVVKVSDLDAQEQQVFRGVAVVSTGRDRAATVLVTGPDGVAQQATIRVRTVRSVGRPDSPRVRDCAGLADTVMPSSLILACGDGSIRASISRWKTWYLNAATGRGRVLVDACRPDCASGRPVAYPATFTLTTLKSVGSRLFFTKLHIHFIDRSPGSRRSVTCPLATPRSIGGCAGPIYGQ